MALKNINVKREENYFLRKLRVERGYSMEKLASILGISTSYLSRLEKGHRRFNTDLLSHLASVFSCHPGDFLNKNADIISLAKEQTFNPEATLPLYDLQNNETGLEINFKRVAQWIPRPFQLFNVNGAFAFRTKENILAGYYSKKDLIYVYPNKPLTIQCKTLIIMRSGEVIIGQFKGWAEEGNTLTENLVIEITERKINRNISLNAIETVCRIVGFIEQD
jgi:transcriptional regulator with XRE-family HTH domain